MSRSDYAYRGVKSRCWCRHRLQPAVDKFGQDLGSRYCGTVAPSSVRTPKGFNTAPSGVAFLGTSDTLRLVAAARADIARIRGLRRDTWHFDPASTVALTSVAHRGTPSGRHGGCTG